MIGGAPSGPARFMQSGHKVGTLRGLDADRLGRSRHVTPSRARIRFARLPPTGRHKLTRSS